MENNLDKSVEELKMIQDDFNNTVMETAEQSEEVKSGKTTVEDEMQEPQNVLFNAITEISIKILQDPMMVKSFQIIANETTKDTANAIINALAISLTTSSYNAILFYDGLLKQELDKQLENIGKHVNLLKADSISHATVLDILRTQVNTISDKLKIKDFIDENNVT